MSIPFLEHIDLNQNELQNAKIQNLASDPGSPVSGQIWFNTTSHQLKIYDGTAVRVIAELSNTLNDFASPVGDLSINTHKLTNVTDPTNAQDAATKNYVDGKFQAAYATAGIVIGSGANVPSTGSKGFLQVPFGATIISWTIIADVVGSAQITVKKSTFAGFPATSSIVASAPPHITSLQNATSSTLTGWTTTITAGDVLEFNLDSVSFCQRITLELKLQRT